jgi:hypothetical protein
MLKEMGDLKMRIEGSVHLSVRTEKLGFYWTDFKIFHISVFFENPPREVTFHEDTSRITGTSEEHLRTFIIYVPKFFLE